MSEQPAALSVDVMGAFAAELGARVSWGEPPCLYTIRMRSGRCHLDRASVPGSWWEDAPLWEVLTRIAETAAGALGIPGIGPRPDNFGIAVRFEGYSAPCDPIDPVLSRHVDAAAASRESRPGRELVAVRVLAGTDRNGVAYYSRQVRGQPTMRSSVSLPAGGRGLSGAVTTAIRQITAAVTGTPPPGQEHRTELGN